MKPHTESFEFCLQLLKIRGRGKRIKPQDYEMGNREACKISRKAQQ